MLRCFFDAEICILVSPSFTKNASTRRSPGWVATFVSSSSLLNDQDYAAFRRRGRPSRWEQMETLADRRHALSSEKFLVERERERERVESALKRKSKKRRVTDGTQKLRNRS
jgi:hypothetical protein